VRTRLGNDSLVTPKPQDPSPKPRYA